MNVFLAIPLGFGFVLFSVYGGGLLFSGALLIMFSFGDKRSISEGINCLKFGLFCIICMLCICICEYYLKTFK